MEINNLVPPRIDDFDELDMICGTIFQVQETIETAIRALPEDSDLDTKLTIKTEPMETTEKSNGDVKEPLHKRIKTDNDKNDEEDSEDEGDINTLDEMMCDIVDALQS